MFRRTTRKRWGTKYTPKKKSTFKRLSWKIPRYYIRNNRNYKPEMKYIDSSFDGVSLDSAGRFLSNPCLIEQGTSENQRIGQRITILRIQGTINLVQDNDVQTANKPIVWHLA